MKEDDNLKLIFEDENVPEIEKGVVLGSGLGNFLEDKDIVKTIHYREVGIPTSSVKGHNGKFSVFKHNGENILAMDGRIHYYETGDMKSVVYPISEMCNAGCEKLILTNASGAVNTDYSVGDLMILNDHINFSFDNPLIGEEPVFMNLENAYNDELISVAENVETDLDVHKGVYSYMPGPVYETPAEVNMIDKLGGDVVGMSTVPECIMANKLNCDVLGLSVVSNYASGISKNEHSHSDVIENVGDVEDEVQEYVSEILDDI